MAVEVKAKKDKIEEQNVVIKKLQERLQNKIDEVQGEQMKKSEIQEELNAVKLEATRKEEEEKEIKQLLGDCKAELELLVMIGQKDKLPRD